jgi:broad specificity phosphatase PhoE
MADVEEESAVDIPSDDNMINFYWVRHAESVANLYNNKPTDKYPNKETDKNLLNEIRLLLQEDYANVEAMLTTPYIPLETKTQGGGGDIVKGDYPLVDEVYTYIKERVTEASNDTDKYSTYEQMCTREKEYSFKKFGDVTDPNNSECIDTLSKNYKKKGTKPGDQEAANFYALWLQNFIPSNFLFQPTLTQCGMVQASILGEQFHETGQLSGVKPDIVITSATVRTMMTAYLTLLYAKDSIQNKTIYIVPYLNEEENDAGYVFARNDKLHDFCNYAIAPNKIRAVGETIVNFFRDAKTHIYSKDGTMSGSLNKDQHIHFDYSLYEDRTNDFRKNNIEKFFDDIIDKETVLNKNKNILAFCHGYVVNKIRDAIFKDYKEINDAIKDLKKGGKNTSVFNTLYEKKGQNDTKKGLKRCKPIFGDINPADPTNLLLSGLLYYPSGETAIRERHNDPKVLSMDKTEHAQHLISLKPGSLRGDIALITHGNGKLESPPVVEESKSQSDLLDELEILKEKLEEFKKEYEKKKEEKPITKDIIKSKNQIDETQQKIDKIMKELGGDTRGGKKRTRKRGRKAYKKTVKGKKEKKSKKVRKNKKGKKRSRKL